MKECARWHGDKHLHKMIVEYAQILSTIWHYYLHADGCNLKKCDCDISSLPKNIYKKSHVLHPVVLWGKENIKHYNAILELAFHLADERRRRRKLFEKQQRKRYKKIHATEEILKILRDNKPQLPDVEWKDPPKCMPECYYTHNGKDLSIIESYRLFYAGHKIQVAKLKWKPIDQPEWLEEYKQIVSMRPDIQQSIDERLEEDRKKRERRKRKKDLSKIESKMKSKFQIKKKKVE